LHTFRRQVVFENDDNDIVFCAVDYGNFRDGNSGWVYKLDEEIKTKIDQFLSGNAPDYGQILEQAIARLIIYNLSCHKVVLDEYSTSY